MPSSSASSLINVSSGRSPASILPPGNSHKPAIGLPSGRRVKSTRPSASISAQAATSTSFTRGSAPVIAVDGDIFLGEVTGQHEVGAVAETKIDHEINHVALHIGGCARFVIGRVARALGRD